MLGAIRIRKNWFGHYMRTDGLMANAVEETIGEREGAGRERFVS